MSLEIERKFLVKSTSFKKESFKKAYIKQGFLNSDKERVVRIRITDTKGFLTIKGKSNDSGVSRFEWEKEISLIDAKKLLDLCEEGIIEKYRYYINYDNYLFEVDQFMGNNKGLIIAEVELDSENDVFKKPAWLSTEVTGDAKYYNSNLSKCSYKEWKK